MVNNRLVLIYGCILSVAILIILFAIRTYRPSLLDIDAKWLIIAGIPILFVLIIGRYITKFKGFGLDIEIAAREELIENPSVFTLFRAVAAKKKEDLHNLYTMSMTEKLKYNVLEFTIRTKDYYDPYAVSEYVKQMPNLKYFVITDSAGKFIALIRFKRPLFENDNIINIREFITKVEEGNFPINDPDITLEYVYSTDNIIKTLETIRISGKKFIAVVVGRHDLQLKGIVTEGKLEKYLANAVLKSLKRKPSIDS